MIRSLLSKRLKGNFVSHIDIERSQKDIRISVHTARPGMVIGRSGENATKLKTELQNLLKRVTPSERLQLHFDIVEIRSPESNAAVVAAMVVEGLEKRMPFRRVMKISVSGMLGAASMSRREELKKGRIPLQTFRADIDFAHDEARLPLGTIGIKVWLYRGDIFEDRKQGQTK